MNGHELHISRRDDVVVARLGGEIDLANTPTVSTKVLEAVPNDAFGLIVDLADVRYIDSVGIRMMFNFIRSLHSSRQAIAVCCPEDSPVRKLLKVTQLDEATVFRSSIDEALVALRESGPPQY